MTTFFRRQPYAAFALILLIGLAVRLYLLPGVGFIPDLEQHHGWVLCAQRDGLLAIYRCDIYAPTHPPVSPTLLTVSMNVVQALGADVSSFSGNAAVAVALKIPNLLFETALIVVVFLIAREKAGLRWANVIAAALYWNPGWMVVTAWWGQNDSSYTLFIVLTAYTFTKDRPRWMWIAYAAAGLAKFQAVIFLPVLAVLAWRRFGLRPNVEGVALGGLMFAAALLPFVIGSGQDALRPFVGTVNLFPYITNGAFNAWYWISGSSPLVIEDSLPFVAGVSYRTAGLIALALGTAVLCWRAWRSSDRAEVYVLLAAANVTFFMLPTQIQARYLYPGLALLALAMIRERRLIALYVGFGIAFTYNVFSIVWLGVGLLYYPGQLLFWSETVNALLMTVLYLIFMGIVLRPLIGVGAPQTQNSQRMST